MRETIKLFHSLPVKKHETSCSPKVIENFIYTGDVVEEYDSDLPQIHKFVKNQLSLTPEQLNSTFHKSWEKIRTAEIEQLVFEQLIHYFTTYGFERLGIYNKDSVYIPHEELNIPQLKEDIELIIIHGITKEETEKKVEAMLTSGVALKEDTINDLLLLHPNINPEIVKNREAKLKLYERLNKVPEDAVELLRFLIYKLTSSTLLIKSSELIEKIKQSETGKVFGHLLKYQKKLSSIFYRFKPLFLAMKKGNESVINKIRKLAKTYHKPYKLPYLQTVTANTDIDLPELSSHLTKANIFQKIRLCNALRYRENGNESILYRIRNGKAYAKEFDGGVHGVPPWLITRLIKDQIEVLNKSIYIPENIRYPLPSSEKSFTGNLPLGTSITMEDDMVFGIHWNNVGSHRIDLDLSLVNAKEKFGWDRYYRNESRSILFSGDVTDALKGATEAFYVKQKTPGNYLLIVNYYNYDKEIPVPFRIFVNEGEIKEEKYVVDKNKEIISASTILQRTQRLLGLIKITEESSTFYFCETDIGINITARSTDYIKHAVNYLFSHYPNLLTLNELITVTDKENCDIDLSPKQLQKDSILSLIS